MLENHSQQKIENPGLAVLKELTKLAETPDGYKRIVDALSENGRNAEMIRAAINEGMFPMIEEINRGIID